MRLETPDAVERDFQRKEHPGRRHQQDDQRDSLHALPGVDHGVEIADDEFLTGGQIVAQQLQHHFVHHARMKNAADQGHHQHDEGEERQDRIGGDREGEGVHLGPHQVLHRRNHQAGDCADVSDAGTDAGTAELGKRRIGRVGHGKLRS